MDAPLIVCGATDFHDRCIWVCLVDIYPKDWITVSIFIIKSVCRVDGAIVEGIHIGAKRIIWESKREGALWLSIIDSYHKEDSSLIEVNSRKEVSGDKVRRKRGWAILYINRDCGIIESA